MKREIKGVVMREGYINYLVGKAGLSVLLLSLIIITVVNSITLRIQLYKIGNYPILLTTINSFMFVCIMLPICLCLGRTESEKRSKTIHFIVMAFLDSTGSILVMIGGSLISGPLQLLLGKFDMILIIAFSKFLTFYGLMSSFYKWNHYTGAFFILSGIICVVLPKLIKGHDVDNKPIGIAIFVLSALPFSISTIYKEIASKTYSLGPIFLNTQIAIWQLLFSILFTPIIMIPGFGSVSFNKIPENMLDGIKCIVLGENSQKGDECPNAWIILVVYTGVNLVYNVLSLATIRYASSAMTVITIAVALPISTILFSLQFIMGHHAVSVDYTNYIALALVILGFILYRLISESNSSQKLDLGVETMIGDYEDQNFVNQQDENLEDDVRESLLASIEKAVAIDLNVENLEGYDE